MRRALVLAAALALWAAPARARDTIKADQDYGNTWRALNLSAPATSGEPVRRGDMPASGLPCGVVFTGGTPLFRCDVVQAAGATTGGADFQGPGAYLTGLTGGGTATGPGSASLTLHLDAGLTYVQGLLPLTNVAGGGATTGQILGWTGTAWAPTNPASSAPGGTGFGVASGGAWAATRTLTTAGSLSITNPTGAAGNPVLDLANVPAGTPVLGELLATGTSATATPSAGFGRCRFDATNRNWTCIDAYGLETHGVASSVGANFITGIRPDGSIVRGGVSATQVAGLWPVALTGNGSDLNPASTPLDRLAQSGATSGQTPTWSGTAWVPGTPATGGITQLTGQVLAGPGSGSQATTLATNTVTLAQMQQFAGLSLLGRSANSTGNMAAITATSGSNGVLREAGGALGFGNISASVLSGLVPCGNLPALTGDVTSVGCTTSFRGFAARSVLARAGATSGAPADLASTTSGDVLWNNAGTLTWGAIPESSVTNLTIDLAGKQATVAWPTAGLVMSSTGSGPTGDTAFTLNTATHLVSADHLVLTGADGSSFALSMTGAIVQQINKANERLFLGTSTAHDVGLYTNNITRLKLLSAGGVQIPGFGAGHVQSDASGNLSIDTTSYQPTITWPGGVLYGAAGALNSYSTTATRVLLGAGGGLTDDAGLTYGSSTLNVGNTSSGATARIVSGSVGDGGLRLWHDTTPTSAANLGLSVPGGSLTTDAILSTFNGATWLENLRALNGGGVKIKSLGTGVVKASGDLLGLAGSGDYVASLGFTAGEAQNNGTALNPIVGLTHPVAAGACSFCSVTWGNDGRITAASGASWPANGDVLFMASGVPSGNSSFIYSPGTNVLTLAAGGIDMPNADGSGASTSGWITSATRGLIGTTSTNHVMLNIPSASGASLDLVTAANDTAPIYSFGKDGTVNFGDGTNDGVLRLVSAPTSGAFTTWRKDTTPTKAVAIGSSVPGTAPTADLYFSSFDGTAWSELGHWQNGSVLTVQHNLAVNGVAANSMVKTDASHNLTAAGVGTDYVQTASATAPVVNGGTAANPNFTLQSSHITTGAGTYNVGTASITVDTYGLVTSATATSSPAPFDEMHLLGASFNGITTNAWLVPGQTFPDQQAGSAPPETRLAFVPVKVRLLAHNLSAAPSSSCNVQFAISKSSSPVVATELSVTSTTTANTFQDSGIVSVSATSTDSWGVILSSAPSNMTGCNFEVYVTAYFYAN